MKNTLIYNDRIDFIKPKLRPGNYSIIREMVNNVYSERTIRAMFTKYRTMNTRVLQAAELLIYTVDSLKNNTTNDKNDENKNKN